ncbi:MAG: WG repeat-containing protein [Spirochaetales bacterium]|nr:WG repeat-containing protein [Spirochaetales bacterium]
MNRKIIHGNKKFGFIDDTGSYVIKPLYSDARDILNGFAVIALKKKGEFIGKKIFDRASNFLERFARVQEKIAC